MKTNWKINLELNQKNRSYPIYSQDINFQRKSVPIYLPVFLILFTIFGCSSSLSTSKKVPYSNTIKPIPIYQLECEYDGYMSLIFHEPEGWGLSLESKIQALREDLVYTKIKCPEKKIAFYGFGERINHTIPIVNYKINDLFEIYLPAQKAEGDKVSLDRRIVWTNKYEEKKAIMKDGYPFFAFDKPVNGSIGIYWFSELQGGFRNSFLKGEISFDPSSPPTSHFHTVIKDKSELRRLREELDELQQGSYSGKFFPAHMKMLEEGIAKIPDGSFSIIDDPDLSCNHYGFDNVLTAIDMENVIDVTNNPHFYAFTKESLNRYFIENLDSFKHINNYSMIKDELNKIDGLIAEKTSFKHYDIEVKEADVRKVITNSTMSNRNKDILFQETLRNPNMTPYEYEYLKQQLSQNTYATKEISPRQEIKKNKNIESSYLKREKAFGFDQKLPTIKPTWEEIINHFGSYSKLAENNINKEDYEIGNYDISVELLNIELLSPETFLAEIQFKAENDNALTIKKIPKSIIKIEGNYNINSLKLKDLFLIGKTFEPFIDFYFKKNKELAFMKDDNQLFSTKLSYPWNAFNENYPIEDFLNYKRTANLLLDDNLKYEDLIVWIVNNDL